ncbi:MAG: hypothetical protein AB7U83_18430 [Vicinamibacterales bacterium]
MPRRPAVGYSLVELVLVAAVVGVAAAVGLPVVVHALDAADAAAAARHLAGLVAKARVEAARRQRVVAVRVERSGTELLVSLVVDGDGDGVSAADVGDGTDPCIRPPEPLSAHFARAGFGIASGVRGIDGESLLPGDDPVRLGPSSQLSIAPVGTSTSGTLYVSSRRGVQFAVRVAGVTGRVRVLRFVPGLGRWRPA